MKKYIFTFLIILLSTQVVFADYGVQTKTSNCVASVLPDPACSPGAILTTNIKTICTVGYTKTVRDVSTDTKKKVFKKYDIPYSQHSNYEVDHIISLELGGSNDISNLFPESYLIKNGARVKDKLENYLHKQVCNGTITITEAQKEISSNWLQYYDQYFNIKATTIVPVVSTPTTTNPTTSTASVNITLPIVKKSSSGLCHARGTRYYTQTLKYTAYASIDACLASGGKLPK
jgi:hypothetical protein